MADNSFIIDTLEPVRCEARIDRDADRTSCIMSIRDRSVIASAVNLTASGLS